MSLPFSPHLCHETGDPLSFSFSIQNMELGRGRKRLGQDWGEDLDGGKAVEQGGKGPLWDKGLRNYGSQNFQLQCLQWLLGCIPTHCNPPTSDTATTSNFRPEFPSSSGQLKNRIQIQYFTSLDVPSRHAHAQAHTERDI